MDSTQERPLEIERKFLITNFRPHFIPQEVPGRDMVQYYLRSNDERERRLRKTWKNGSWEYDYTEKFPTGDAIARVEPPKKLLSLAEFVSMLSERDPRYAPVAKCRYAFSPCGQLFELDRYQKINGLYTVEHEMDRPDIKVVKPDGWEWIDVTYEPDYKNRRIAELLQLGLGSRLLHFSAPQA